jgi:hypothetical protein
VTRVRVLALAVTAAFVSPLGAQAGDPRLTRLDPAVRPVVVALVDSARAAGLPTEPLVQRALEGTSKRAAGDRVVAAVRRLARDLGTARSALGPAATGPEIDAGAAALYAGARPADLTALRARRPRQSSLVVPLGVLADLVATGVPAATAAAAVLALAATTADDDYLAFRRNVERDIALGAPPAAAAAVRSTAATADAIPKP